MPPPTPPMSEPENPSENIVSPDAMPKRASFVGLPRELRDEIYRHALVLSEPVDLEMVKKARTSKREIRGVHMSNSGRPYVALLRANSTVHAEATPVLYGKNQFSMHGFSERQVKQFRRRIGRTNARHIRSVHVWLGYRIVQHLRIKKLGKIFPNVKSVTFVATSCTALWISPDHLVRYLDKVNADLRAFRKGQVESGKPEPKFKFHISGELTQRVNNELKRLDWDIDHRP